MIPENITALIEEMIEVRDAYPILEVPDVLRIFNIQSLRDLTGEMRRLANGR